MSSDKVEVGVTLLSKTVNATETPIAFMRVRDIKTSIQEYINKQQELGNVVDHPQFNDEIWIKIGVRFTIVYFSNFMIILVYTCRMQKVSYIIFK